MHKKLLFSLALIFNCAVISGANAVPDQINFADTVEELIPSVVNISTSQKVIEDRRQAMPNFPQGSPFEEFFKHYYGDMAPETGKEKTLYSLGSGFIISEDGYVVTNAHVIQKADTIEIKLWDDEVVKATLIGIDKKTDIALLKVETNKKLKPVMLGNSNTARVGEWVIAIGNPFGLGGSVSVGVISAIARDLEDSGYVDYIQTDAAINRGNSGGPLFDQYGKLIGINTAIFSNSGGNIGIGFAIPIASVMPIIEQLKTQGHVTRGWLGVAIQLVTDDIAKIVGMESAYGAYVVSVTEESPAEEAGIESDDIITEFDGIKIESVRDLPRVVGNTAVGKKVKIKLLRHTEDGYKEKRLKVKVGVFDEDKLEKEEETEDESPVPDIKSIQGIKYVELNDDVRSSYNVSNTVKSGVLIVDFEENSNVTLQGLEIGDVIVAADQQNVKDGKHFQEIVGNAKSKGKSSILIRVQRAEASFVMALHLN